jgi:hypothetical protein
MTDCSVYVGKIDDPSFKWEGGDSNGNVPGRISPEFPPMSRPYNGPFHAWVSSAGIKCIKTDYAGWVACVTKFQIIEFITEAYRGHEKLPWVEQQLIELNDFVCTLDEDLVYALVATEW